jgi:hypothetical protein
MLESLRQLWKKRSLRIDIEPMRAWAAAHDHECKPVHEAEGCTVEPRGDAAWRIEWGLPQRDYIPDRELRIIGDIGTPRELMAMVLTRELKEAMEKIVFEQYVEDVQTRMDTETPPEMRWLVLYTKLPGTELGRLRERYAAVGSVKPWVTQWLSGPLNDALAATLDATTESEPMVLTVGRGRLTLRASMPEVDERRLAMWLSVFEHAQREARRLGDAWREAPDSSNSTQPAAWARSSLIDHDPAP